MKSFIRKNYVYLMLTATGISTAFLGQASAGVAEEEKFKCTFKLVESAVELKVEFSDKMDYLRQPLNMVKGKGWYLELARAGSKIPEEERRPEENPIRYEDFTKGSIVATVTKPLVSAVSMTVVEPAAKAVYLKHTLPQEDPFGKMEAVELTCTK